MTVNEAIQQLQGHRAGMFNGLSARYAQAKLLPGEAVSTAVVANITTPSEHFPGVVVLTDRRVLAACGLPGIKRFVACHLDELRKCEEKPSAINYKITFSDGKNVFSLTVDPEIGEKFSRYIAVSKGEAAEFDAVHVDSNGIFNPTLMRNKARTRQAQDKERARRAAQREQAQLESLQHNDLQAGTDDESAQETAHRLAQQLDAAKAKGIVKDTDPQAVAARIAAELAEAESHQSE